MLRKSADRSQVQNSPVVNLHCIPSLLFQEKFSQITGETGNVFYVFLFWIWKKNLIWFTSHVPRLFIFEEFTIPWVTQISFCLSLLLQSEGPIHTVQLFIKLFFCFGRMKSWIVCYRHENATTGWKVDRKVETKSYDRH